MTMYDPDNEQHLNYLERHKRTMNDALKQPADEDLKPFGWAPGGYAINCIECPKNVRGMAMQNGGGDKRSLRCKKHATEAWRRGPIQIDYSREERYVEIADRILHSVHPAVDLVRIFKAHDVRVEELIRYNSEEVIKRRVLKAKLDFCLTLMTKLRDVLRRYARNHRNKNTLEAAQKAEVNDQLADEIDAAFCYDPDPSDYGKA